MRQRGLLLCAQALARRRGVATTTAAAEEAAAAAPAAASSSASSADATSSRVYAACVLERLPILKSPPPIWELEHQAWRQERKLASGQLKRYPQLGDARQRGADGGGADGSGGGGGAGASANSTSDADRAASCETPADRAGNARTMKRRLRDKLVLLVKSGGGGGSQWRFPSAEHRDGETIRATAERALREAIGDRAPLFFIGNAPMAHLVEGQEGIGGSSSGDSTRRASGGAKTTKTFFHLAQVLNDPWDVELARGGAAQDFAWVAPDELDKYLGGAAGGGGGGGAAAASGGPSLLDLTRRMV